MRLLFGSQNFGFDTPESDKDYIDLVFPTLSQICHDLPRVKEHKTDLGIIKSIDIRRLPKLFHTSNLDILQLLFSKEVTSDNIFDDYLKLYLEKYEQELTTMNVPRLYKSITGGAFNRSKKGANKDYIHNIFGYKLLVKFADLNFTDMRSIFNHGDYDEYLEMRTNNLELLKINNNWKHLAESKSEMYSSYIENTIFLSKFREDISQMVVEYLK